MGDISLNKANVGRRPAILLNGDTLNHSKRLKNLPEISFLHQVRDISCLIVASLWQSQVLHNAGHLCMYVRLHPFITTATASLPARGWTEDVTSCKVQGSQDLTAMFICRFEISSLQGPWPAFWMEFS